MCNYGRPNLRRKLLRPTLEEEEKVGMKLANDTGHVGEE